MPPLSLEGKTTELALPLANWRRVRRLEPTVGAATLAGGEEGGALNPGGRELATGEETGATVGAATVAAGEETGAVRQLERPLQPVRRKGVS